MITLWKLQLSQLIAKIQDFRPYAMKVCDKRSKKMERKTVGKHNIVFFFFGCQQRYSYFQAIITDLLSSFAYSSSRLLYLYWNIVKIQKKNQQIQKASLKSMCDIISFRSNRVFSPLRCFFSLFCFPSDCMEYLHTVMELFLGIESTHDIGTCHLIFSYSGLAFEAKQRKGPIGTTFRRTMMTSKSVLRSHTKP